MIELYKMILELEKRMRCRYSYSTDTWTCDLHNNSIKEYIKDIKNRLKECFTEGEKEFFNICKIDDDNDIPDWGKEDPVAYGRYKKRMGEEISNPIENTDCLECKECIEMYNQLLVVIKHLYKRIGKLENKNV